MIGMAAALLWLARAAGRWRCFQKMGCRGWEGVVPVYSTWLLFQELYGSGWKILCLLVPFCNVYFFFRHSVRLAYAFNQSTRFGAGLMLLPFLFFRCWALGEPSIWTDSWQRSKLKNLYSQAVKTIPGGPFSVIHRCFSLNYAKYFSGEAPCLTGKSLAHPALPFYTYKF